jgi:hypothetical protein
MEHTISTGDPWLMLVPRQKAIAVPVAPFARLRCRMKPYRQMEGACRATERRQLAPATATPPHCGEATILGIPGRGRRRGCVRWSSAEVHVLLLRVAPCRWCPRDRSPGNPRWYGRLGRPSAVTSVTPLVVELVVPARRSDFRVAAFTLA